MNTRHILIIAATSLTLNTGISAVAGTKMADKLDTNKDGLIQFSEFADHANQKFTRMDANGDGVVNQDERKAFHEAKRDEHLTKRFARLDANDDGLVSPSEYKNAADERRARRLEKLDINGDGEITKEDRIARRKHHKRRHKMKRPPKIDSNGDGLLDKAEHDAFTKHRFDRLDKNENGVLEADEQHRRRFGARHRHHPKGPRPGFDQ